MSSDNDRQQNRARPGMEGWDRIGELLGRMGETGQVVANRNLEVWKEIRASLDKRDFGADDWARDNLLVLGAMLDNAQAMAGLWTTAAPPAAAGALRTVFLSVQVDRSGGGQDVTAAAAEASALSTVEHLPKTGTAVLSGLDQDTVDALCAAITVTQDVTDPSKYHVEFSWPPDAKTVIADGSYFGLIYLEPPRSDSLLADLRVLVRSV
jgi:hypothetical protein